YQGTTSGGTSTAIASTTANVTTLGTTTQYFRAQSAAGCWGIEGSTAVTVNAAPNVSDFNTSAASVCPSTATTVTATSSTLPDATYTVLYDLSGSNTATAATASMVFSGGNGTFTVPGTSLANAGNTTITITKVQNASASCSSNLSSGNTSSFTIYTAPAT